MVSWVVEGGPAWRDDALDAVQLSMEQELLAIRMHLSSADPPSSDPMDGEGMGGAGGGSGHQLTAMAPLPSVSAAQWPLQVDAGEGQRDPREIGARGDGASEHHIHLHFNSRTSRSHGLVGPAYGRYTNPLDSSRNVKCHASALRKLWS